MISTSTRFGPNSTTSPSGEEGRSPANKFFAATSSAQMIAKGYILSQGFAASEGVLPATGRPVRWATLDPAPADKRADTERAGAVSQVRSEKL